MTTEDLQTMKMSIYLLLAPTALILLGCAPIYAQ